MKLPPGLVLALQGIAERLEQAPRVGFEKGTENSKALFSTMDREHFVQVFTDQWIKDGAAAAAREIRSALEIWQKPAPRTRRGRR